MPNDSTPAACRLALGPAPPGPLPPACRPCPFPFLPLMARPTDRPPLTVAAALRRITAEAIERDPSLGERKDPHPARGADHDTTKK